MKQILIILCGIMLFAVSCKKEPEAPLTGPTTYNFTVVNEFTNEPVAGIYLLTIGPDYHYDTIGKTGSDGKLTFTFDTLPAGSDINSKYFIFGNMEYAFATFGNLEQSHKSKDIQIKLNKYSTLKITFKQTYADQVYIKFGDFNDFSDVDITSFKPISWADSVRYLNKKSNIKLYINWSTVFDFSKPWYLDSLNMGYEDTAVYRIEF